MTKRIYITTPIYYVNDKPHLGHVYTTVAADFLARYHRIEGREVFFLTGTDEHGQKAEQAARAKGQSTKDHVDFHSAVFRDLWKKMNISNDDFIRTTEERHTKVVQAVLQHLFDRGEIYEDTYEGWYCVPDERFWTEKDLADGNCPECGRKVERIKEKNYFFRMGKHQQWLIEYIKANEDYISPPTRRNEVLGFLQKKLEDLCISRPKSRMAWGVELPFDSDYVSYVWFDALLNYISAPGYQSDEKKFSEIWPADIHMIGKDILTTHAVYWSTMLKDMGLPLPRKIFAHGWWTIEGRKMSKSFGNVVDPVTVADAVGLDPFRYFLMREVPFGLDGDFSVEALVTRINVDLANNLGNLVSRTLKMIAKYRGGVVPSPHGAPADKLKTGAEQAARSYAAHMDGPAFHKALEEIISLCDIVNGFIMENEPWKLAKDKSQSDRLDDVLYGSAEALRFIGRMIAPIMPETGAKLLDLLGMEKGCYGLFEWGGLAPGTQVKDGDPLFPRIDDKTKEAITQAILPSGEDEEESGLIAIEDVRKIDLRTAKIVKAERIEKSRKLLKLIVDLGFEKRQIVAGIAESYLPEELVGKQVVVVANLRPAKLMGVESKGMLLAADNEGKLSLIGATNEVNGGLKVL